jgi:putative transposase
MISGHVPAACFLLITQVIMWLPLSRREDAWKTAEILILRHQLTVRQRHQGVRARGSSC